MFVLKISKTNRDIKLLLKQRLYFTQLSQILLNGNFFLDIRPLSVAAHHLSFHSRPVQ